MLGKLVPCGGGPPVILNRTKLVIGRKPECEITLACPSISGRHCLLEFEDGSWWVRDLESKHGTSVNGRKSAKLRIAPKDILGVGRQRMVVEYQTTPKSEVTAKQAGFQADEDLAFDLLNSGPPDKPLEQPAPVSPSLAAPPVSRSVAVPAISRAPVPRPTAVTDLGRLVPCGGGAPIPLRDTALIVGRSTECDICIRFPSVSSRHCKLDFEAGYWMVEDLNSTNGTWVDGDRCMYQCLMPESILALHKYRYTIHYIPRGDGDPPAVKQLFSQSLLEKAGLAREFSGDRLSGQLLPDDSLDLPKRYNLLDPHDE